MPDPVTTSQDYRVRLEAFDGPLDLLLYLIRRAEVDLHEISIADITDQYVQSLREADRIDIELAGEFLVMAATLMEIKARMLSSQSQDAGNGEHTPRPDRDDLQGDPRADLIRQLLDYKAFRDAAAGLQSRLKEWSRRYPSARMKTDPVPADEPGATDLDDLDLMDLVRAFEGICASVNFESLGDHQITYDDTPIELHAADIIDRLKSCDGVDEHGRIPLAEIFRGRSRSEMIGLFVAALELVRRRELLVSQDDPTGAITISLGEPSDETPAPIAQ